MALLLANWKAKSDLQLMLDLVAKVPEGSDHVILFPPSPYLWPLARVMPEGAHLGLQNVSEFSDGAYTGEVTGLMAKEVDARYVIIGHSERRGHFQESVDQLQLKFDQCLVNSLIPVICVGLQDDDSSSEAVEALLEQIPDLSMANEVFLAYEPVFAIGTGQVASYDHIEIVLKKLATALRSRYANLKMSFLYGGSVNSENIADIIAIEECDGVLVGSASLKLTQWGQLLEKCITYS